MATIEPGWHSDFDDGHTFVRFTGPLAENGELRATFDLGPGKGLLGPSEDPTDQSGLENSDQTLFAVNRQPATKSSFVHIFLRSEEGDILFLNQCNRRLATLLPERWAVAAADFLRVESVSGRQLTLQTTEFTDAARSHHEFRVEISPQGDFSLLSSADQNHNQKEK